MEYDKQVAQLVDLIAVINTDLTKNERKKLITLCTIDVHSRDVVSRLMEERVESASCFQWQSQLRYYQNEKTKECQVLLLMRPLVFLHVPTAYHACSAPLRSVSPGTELSNHTVTRT